MYTGRNTDRNIKPVDICRKEKVNKLVCSISFLLSEVNKASKREEEAQYGGKMRKHSPGAYQSGLNVNDELIAIDNYRVTKEYSRLYELKKVGDTIDVLINRQGVIMEMKVDLTQNRQVDYELVPVKRPGKLAQQIRKSWLGS